MPQQVDVRVSPSLHPETFSGLDGYNSETVKFVADALSAFNDAYVTIGKIHDARAFANRNPTWTDEQRTLIVGKEATKQQDRLCNKFDAARANIEKGAQHIEGELSRPLKERAGLGNLNQEVRGHVKALNPTDRTALLNDAFQTNDVDTLQAVLGAQPFLSGLSAPEHAHYLRRFHEGQNPQLVDRLTLMRSALTKIERDAPLLFREVEKAVGAPPAIVNGIDAANEAALAALKIEPAA